jgi:hypothetical protein
MPKDWTRPVCEMRCSSPTQQVLGERRKVIMTCLETTIVAGKTRLADVQSPKEVRVPKAYMRDGSGLSQI